MRNWVIIGCDREDETGGGGPGVATNGRTRTFGAPLFQLISVDTNCFS